MKSFPTCVQYQHGGGSGGVVGYTPLYWQRYVLRDKVWILRFPIPWIGYHFCPCWHCVSDMNLLDWVLIFISLNSKCSAKWKNKFCACCLTSNVTETKWSYAVHAILSFFPLEQGVNLGDLVPLNWESICLCFIPKKCEGFRPFKAHTFQPLLIGLVKSIACT